MPIVELLCCNSTERTALLADAASTQGAPGNANKRKPASASPGAIFASKGKSDLTAGEGDAKMLTCFTFCIFNKCMCYIIDR